MTLHSIYSPLSYRQNLTGGQRKADFKPLFCLLAAMFFVSACTVIEPPEAYPPARYPMPSKSNPVIKRPIPQANRPVIDKSAKPVEVQVEVDKPEQGDNPYDSVPQRASSTSALPASDKPAPQSNVPVSAAVKSLLKQAKVDMLAQRNSAAINKLERALRIESRNPVVWHQLAKAYFNDNKDTSAIAMAKKSNIYVAEGSPLEKLNWQVIKAASKRSGNIKLLKDAIRYERAHP